MHHNMEAAEASVDNSVVVDDDGGGDGDDVPLSYICVVDLVDSERLHSRN